MRENKKKRKVYNQEFFAFLLLFFQEDWPLKADKGKSPVLHVSNLQYRGRSTLQCLQLLTMKAVHKHSEMIIIHLFKFLHLGTLKGKEIGFNKN